jgi:hypothetical protein
MSVECKACDEYNRVKRLLDTTLALVCGNVSMTMAHVRQDHVGKAQTEVRALNANLAEVSRHLTAMMQLKKDKANEQAQQSSNPQS